MNIVFHVGLHKTATTWLQSVLFTLHQEIRLINDYKEPWNDEVIRYVVLRDRYSFDAEIYKKMIQARIKSEFPDQEGVFIVSAERLSGHPSSGGFDREKIIANIHAAFPDAKILITFRNQIVILRTEKRALPTLSIKKNIMFLGISFSYHLLVCRAHQIDLVTKCN